MFPNQDRAEFTKDSRARKAIIFTAMLATREMDEVAPCVAASRRFLESLYEKIVIPELLRSCRWMDITGMEVALSELTQVERPTLRPKPESKYSPEFHEIMMAFIIVECR